jgi:alpha-beta hydrolase superfamily lysophospholipase
MFMTDHGVLEGDYVTTLAQSCHARSVSLAPDGRVSDRAIFMLQTYADGRHESPNEINRDLVTRDLIAWLDGVIDRGRRAPAAVTG